MILTIFKVIVLFGAYTATKALSTDELKENYAQMIVECFKENPITMEDLEQLKNKIMPENYTAKCLFACAYRKAGMMNDKGELSVEGVNEMTRKYFSDDAEKIRKSEEFTNACKSVNDEAVSDGEKGCERASLIFKCTVQKAPEFDFV